MPLLGRIDLSVIYFFLFCRYNDATSKLFKAFVPYSHLDGDCGWVDDVLPAAEARWARLAGRPTLYLGECAVATQEGPAWLAKLGLNGSAGHGL